MDATSKSLDLFLVAACYFLLHSLVDFEFGSDVLHCVFPSVVVMATKLDVETNSFDTGPTFHKHRWFHSVIQWEWQNYE